MRHCAIAHALQPQPKSSGRLRALEHRTALELEMLVEAAVQRVWRLASGVWRRVWTHTRRRALDITLLAAGPFEHRRCCGLTTIPWPESFIAHVFLGCPPVESSSRQRPANWLLGAKIPRSRSIPFPLPCRSPLRTPSGCHRVPVWPRAEPALTRNPSFNTTAVPRLASQPPTTCIPT
ncbi:hypothetical protein P171DRAFT_126455 [Karstenula rhodostoma CBS 690.94]|uniref:Uncharacterized protein n=1 Tax=Karstenula rhodostoma CBS 690.94 TaxID=1392251 RepID=A0A9P4U7B2_9PLEO|nr:hypothetical protein P171DRAFT_126455 [Karstenula rhodostoma CBS 690.94]